MTSILDAPSRAAPIPMIAAATDARVLSSMKGEGMVASGTSRKPSATTSAPTRTSALIGRTQAIVHSDRPALIAAEKPE